ncbi:ATP-binding cassette domain-containing protein [Exiguobacterium sp. SL14]|nr:ATP-binding cassette domain-containing protein [Exiguobacterium sp. SL14]MCY1691475.1 ATP-binding cassette domain-containing protein [Exiguobacterium sp. SL14]
MNTDFSALSQIDWERFVPLLLIYISINLVLLSLRLYRLGQTQRPNRHTDYMVINHSPRPANRLDSLLRPRKEDDRMIQISHLKLSLQRRLILDDISFTIHEHECLGLIGPNGAGKTKLLKCLSGMIESDRGSITMYDRPIRQQKQAIGYLSQQTDFKPWMTCEQSRVSLDACLVLIAQR